jgi:hypothetical protein
MRSREDATKSLDKAYRGARHERGDDKNRRAKRSGKTRLALHEDDFVAALKEWMGAERAKLSRHVAVAKAIDYMLTRWDAFVRFLDDGRICLRRRVTIARTG